MIRPFPFAILLVLFIAVFPACTVKNAPPSQGVTATATTLPDQSTPASPSSPVAASSSGSGAAPHASSDAEGAPWASRPAQTQPAGAPTPTAGQPCPAWVHDRYAVQAPDGRWYPSWHPPTDPEFGCHFGHEHGDDPAGAPALAGRSVPFGYVHYLALGQLEPHEGYKVYRWDNVRHPNAPNHAGAHLLMSLHQGTSGAGRFTTVHHSLQFDYVNPRDGREVHITLLAPFGALLVGCGANDPTMVLRLRQADVPGARQVAADKCFDLPSIPYEDWITALYVGVDDSGKWKAYLDPHFAIFNPATYCIPAGEACEAASSSERAGERVTTDGTDSDYRGTKREAYLNQVWLANEGGEPRFWTDAYGRLVDSDTPGAVAQFVAPITLQPRGNSAAFGADVNHDPDGSVHLPN